MAHRPCSVRRAVNRVAAFYSPETAGSGSRLAQGQRWVSGCWAWCHNPGAEGFITTFPDMRVLMDGLYIQGDRAVYRWTS